VAAWLAIDCDPDNLQALPAKHQLNTWEVSGLTDIEASQVRRVLAAQDAAWHTLNELKPPSYPPVMDIHAERKAEAEGGIKSRKGKKPRHGSKGTQHRQPADGGDTQLPTSIPRHKTIAGQATGSSAVPGITERPRRQSTARVVPNLEGEGRTSRSREPSSRRMTRSETAPAIEDIRRRSKEGSRLRSKDPASTSPSPARQGSPQQQGSKKAGRKTLEVPEAASRPDSARSVGSASSSSRSPARCGSLARARGGS